MYETFHKIKVTPKETILLHVFCFQYLAFSYSVCTKHMKSTRLKSTNKRWRNGKHRQLLFRKAHPYDKVDLWRLTLTYRKLEKVNAKLERPGSQSVSACPMPGLCKSSLRPLLDAAAARTKERGRRLRPNEGG